MSNSLKRPISAQANLVLPTTRYYMVTFLVSTLRLYDYYTAYKNSIVNSNKVYLTSKIRREF